MYLPLIGASGLAGSSAKPTLPGFLKVKVFKF